MSGQENTPIVQASQATADVQTNATSAKTGPTTPAGGNAATTMVSNIEQLQAKEPKLYKMIEEALARNICDELKKHADRMKALYRKNQNA